MRSLRFLLGLIFLPFSLAAIQTTLSLVASLPYPEGVIVPPSALALGGGCLVWVIVYLCLPPPTRAYIFAHELTHALWGALLGSDILDFKISRQQGSVTLSHTNVLVLLAPYFFPLYTLMVIAVYGGLSLVFNLDPFVSAWLFLVGLTWGFHFTFTVRSLLQHQSDLHDCGLVFSYGFIIAMNAIGLCLWIVFVSEPTLYDLSGQFIEHLARNARWIIRSCSALPGLIQRLLPSA